MRRIPPPDGIADRWGNAAGRPGAIPPWSMAVTAAVLTHLAVLAALSHMPPAPRPAAAEAAGVLLLLSPQSPTMQPLGAVTLANHAAPEPRLAAPVPLTIYAGRAASPTAIAHRRVSVAQTMPRATLPPARTVQPQSGVPAQGSAAPARLTATPETPSQDAALLPALEARIDEAVRQAASMPAAARRQHRQGRAQVKFTYVDGVVGAVQLVAHSDSRLLDDAALQAVSRAAYPPPPPALRGRHLDLLVWVNFRIDV